jgi:transketolase
VDCNGLQASDYVENIIRPGDFRGRWESYGFIVLEIDGHDLSAIKNAVSVDRKNLPQSPLVILAHTVKGKGIPMIENNPQWHSRIPKEEELCEMLAEMGMTREEFELL